MAIHRFFNWLLHMTAHIDHASEQAHVVLVETASSDEERIRLEEQWKARVSPIEELKRQRQFLLEVILVRHIENYLNYLSGLLYEIFVQRPETLRSSDRVEIEHVLRHDSIESLVKEIAERKVESLSYSGFSELCAFFSERFKLVVASGDDLRALIEAIEIRNISVHNRCIVNKRFIARTGESELNLGKKKVLGIDRIERVVHLLAERVRALDSDARRRLNVRATRFGAVVLANKPLQPTSGAAAREAARG